MNRSNLSFLALQIGQTPGASSMAQRYPQTLHLHTGFESFPENSMLSIISSLFFPSALSALSVPLKGVFQESIQPLFPPDNLIPKHKAHSSRLHNHSGRVSVVAGTDNIQVFFKVTGREPARTAPVAVASFILQQTTYQVLCELHVRVKVVARFFDLIFQPLIDNIHLFFGYALLIFLSFQPSTSSEAQAFPDFFFLKAHNCLFIVYDSSRERN